MKTSLRIGAIFGLLAVTAFARLDETEAQLIDRYGRVRIRSTANISTNPQNAAGETLVFCLDGWTVTAFVVDGRCKGISYLQSGELTVEQLWHILESNGGHAQWEEMKTDAPEFRREWRRRDQTVAIWQKSQGIKLLSPVCEPRRDEFARNSRDAVAAVSRL